MKKLTGMIFTMAALSFLITACCPRCPTCPKINVICEVDGVTGTVTKTISKPKSTGQFIAPAIPQLDPNKAVQIIGDNIYLSGLYTDKATRVAICGNKNGWCVSAKPTAEDFLELNNGFYVISKAEFVKRIISAEHPVFTATEGMKDIKGRRFNYAVWDAANKKLDYWAKIHTLFGTTNGDFVYQNNLPEDNASKCLLIPEDVIN